MNVVVLVLSLLWLRGTLSCQVFVQTPWEATTFVPADSIIQIECSAADSSLRPYWVINRFLQFANHANKPVLNRRGIFEVEQDDPGVIQMVINSTTNNNGTTIECVYVPDDDIPTALETTLLLLYDSSQQPISLSKSDLSTSTNISWTDLPQLDSYNLIVTSKSYNQTFPEISQPSHIFIFPDNAPPCEVYNFSVTATPVGATYTGNGCGVLSNTLSVVLPSPPRLATVESSIHYYLEKHAGEVMLNISFMPASYCDGYPVTEYVVEVEGPTSESLVLSPARILNAANTLLDDQVYTFRVVASNAVGNDSTTSRQIFTTDVQNITAEPLAETNAVLLRCTFAVASDAQGCMVVLVSHALGNVTKILNRSNSSDAVEEYVNITHPLPCYMRVFGYDIESDGAIGTLAVPGEIMTDGVSLEPCVSPTVGLNPTQAANIPIWIYGAIGGFVALAVFLLALILIVIINHRVKRSRTHRSDSIKNFFPSSPAMSPAGSPAGPAPESPPPPPKDHLGGKEKEEKLEGDPSPLYDLPEKFTSSCIQQQEHTYHVLENSAAHYQFNAQDFHKQANGVAVHQDTTRHSHETSLPHGSHSLTTGPPPIYQDITEFSASRGQGDGEEERYDEVGDHTSQTDSSPPPVYQEITGLTSGRVLSRPLDNMPSAGTNV